MKVESVLILYYTNKSNIFIVKELYGSLDYTLKIVELYYCI